MNIAPPTAGPSAANSATMLIIGNKEGSRRLGHRRSLAQGDVSTNRIEQRSPRSPYLCGIPATCSRVGAETISTPLDSIRKAIR